MSCVIVLDNFSNLMDLLSQFRKEPDRMAESIASQRSSLDSHFDRPQDGECLFPGQVDQTPRVSTRSLFREYGTTIKYSIDSQNKFGHRGVYRSHAITNILGTKSNMNEYIMTIAFKRTYKRSLCDCYKTFKKYVNLLESITRSRQIIGLAINM